MENKHVALIGYGYWGKILEKYIYESSVFTLKKIFKRSYSEPHSLFTSNLDDILLDPEITAVFIASPIETHFSYAKHALLHSKHVFCEKTLCRSVNDIDTLHNIAEEKNVKLFTDYIYTVSPSINKLKELLPTLGKPLYIEGALNQFGKFYTDDVFEVLLSHLVSVIIYLFPKMQFSINKKCYTQVDGVVDTGELILESPDDIYISLKASLRAIHRERYLRLYFENSSVEFNMLRESTLTISYHSKDNYTLIKDRVEEYAFDEANNLETGIQLFYNICNSDLPDNIELSKKVTSIINS